MTGYSMTTARKIMMNSSFGLISENHVDYAAGLELYRMYISEEYEPMTLLLLACNLGMAIGTRNERARRRGELIERLAEADIEEAREEVQKAKDIREFRELYSQLNKENKEKVKESLLSLAAGSEIE